MAYGTEGLCIRKDLEGKEKEQLWWFLQFAIWDYPPEVLCSQEGPDLKPDEINGKKSLWYQKVLDQELLSFQFVSEKNSLHQLDHLVSLFGSSFIVII